MRCKWARRLVLCLMLGALVNLGMAWGCSLGFAYADTKILAGTMQYRLTFVREWPIKGMPPAEAIGRGTITAYGVTNSYYSESKRGHPWMLYRSAGLPLHAFHAWTDDWRTPRTPQTPPGASALHWRFAVDIRGTVFPYRPMPLGFTVNTLLYAALLFLLTLGLSVFKRRRRLRGGLCVRCGYDITGLTACPECGTPVLHSPPSAT